MILPGAAHREVGFPGTIEGDAGDILLGCLDRAARDDDSGLELPREFAQPLRLAVEKHEIDGAVVREQLADLRLIVREQTGVFRELYVGGVALDRDAVFPQPPEIVGRVIEAGRDTLGAKSRQDFGGDVALERGVRDVKISRCGRPQAEARMMFGREDHVAEPGELRERGPVLRVELARVEGEG